MLGFQARLGGWLGDGLPQRPTRLCQLAAPLLNALHGAYLDPLLLSLITLRDSVRRHSGKLRSWSSADA